MSGAGPRDASHDAPHAASPDAPPAGTSTPVPPAPATPSDRPGAAAPPSPAPGGLFAGYDAGRFFCELLGERDAPVEALATIAARLRAMPVEEVRRRARVAEEELYNLGITFTVYSDKDAIDRILPFDLIPRILSAAEWDHVERGVVQRVAALNAFLHDIYHDGRILADGVVPRALVEGNSNYRPEMIGLDVPLGTYVHVCGTDIVRDEPGTSWCWRTMPARRPASPTSSRTGT